MLVLGRKMGEEIMVGGDVRITVVKLDGQTVRLGIEAPANVRIDRAEISKLLRPRRMASRPAARKLARAA